MSDSKLTDRGGRKAHDPRRDSAEATDLNRKRSEETQPARGEERSPGADPSDDPSTRKRDEWKASTRTEGDSTEPSASMATRTCRKAGARDKHTGDVETTPCSARGEEERFEQAPGKRPEERMGLLDSAIQSRHRQSGGRPPSRTCKRKPPGGENLCRTPTKNHGATTTPKEKVREKMRGKLPSCRTNHP